MTTPLEVVETQIPAHTLAAWTYRSAIRNAKDTRSLMDLCRMLGDEIDAFHRCEKKRGIMPHGSVRLANIFRVRTNGGFRRLALRLVRLMEIEADTIIVHGHDVPLPKYALECKVTQHHYYAVPDDWEALPC